MWERHQGCWSYFNLAETRILCLQLRKWGGIYYCGIGAAQGVDIEDTQRYSKSTEDGAHVTDRENTMEVKNAWTKVVNVRKVTAKRDARSKRYSPWLMTGILVIPEASLFMPLLDPLAKQLFGQDILQESQLQSRTLLLVLERRGYLPLTSLINFN